MAVNQGWSQNEDKALCHAFLQITQDAAVGTGQDKGGYWFRIQQAMYQMIGDHASPGGKQRTIDALQSRWKRQIWAKCSKWSQALQTASRVVATGTNLIDETLMAETIYCTENDGKYFIFKHCFPIVEDYVALHPSPELRRSARPTAPSQGRMPTPPSFMPESQAWENSFPTATQHTTNLASDFEEPTPSPTLHTGPARASGSRPGGRTQAKGKGKANEPSPVSDLVEQMKQAREANDRIAAEAQQRHVEVQETKNKFLQMKAEENETYIMSMDTSKLTPGQKEHFAAKRRGINARRNLFGDSSQFPNAGDLPPYY